MADGPGSRGPRRGDEDRECHPRDRRRPALAGGVRGRGRRPDEQGRRRRRGRPRPEAGVLARDGRGAPAGAHALPLGSHGAARANLRRCERGEGARVTNGKNFSYPGYNEILSGFADPRIDSNDKRPNPNVTVLEWLNTQPDFRGKVAAFGSWDVFPYILNRERSGLLVNAGWEPIQADDLTESEELLNLLGRETPHVWEGVRFDSFTTQAAIEHLKKRRPRVLYIGLGETDEYAHEGRYDHYLDAAHRFDASLRRLWDAVQSSPHYRDKTSLVVTTDHGRGDAPEGWKHHGATTKGSEMIWLAAIGPDTPTTGAPIDPGPITQSQVAATVAALLGKGEAFLAASPKAAKPIASVIGRP